MPHIYTIQCKRSNIQVPYLQRIVISFVIIPLSLHISLTNSRDFPRASCIRYRVYSTIISLQDKLTFKLIYKTQLALVVFFKSALKTMFANKLGKKTYVNELGHCSVKCFNKCRSETNSFGGKTSVTGSTSVQICHTFMALPSWNQEFQDYHPVFIWNIKSYAKITIICS